MIKAVYKKPPVLILGGTFNALSITRSLGRRGVKIYMSVFKNTIALYSRYYTQCFPFPDKETVHEFWMELLSNEHDHIPHGSVIFPCNDDAVEFVAKNRDELENNYILDDSVPEIHLAMLDKKKTLQMAKSLNIHIPNFWEIENLEDLEPIASEVVFPVIIKPIHSHLFQKQFDAKKYFFTNNIDEMYSCLKRALDQNLKVMISEFIPGPDSMLGSYYTYIDSNGNPLFHLTKRIIRRSPPNEGLACYHKTEWDQEIAELGLKFFKGINFRGLGNIEFKKDLRDGHLKVIECNPRFTVPQELLVRCGMDSSVIIYNHLVGLPIPEVNSYKQNLRLWFPFKDFTAFRVLKRKKEITFWSWIKSIFHKQVLPCFQWSDPLPSIKYFFRFVRQYL